MFKSKFIIISVLSVLIISLSSCSQETTTQEDLKNISSINNWEDRIFPNWMKVPETNFTWDVYLTMLTTDQDKIFNTQTYNVEFKAWARTNWHSHAGWQLLIATQWIGYYQEEWSPIREVYPWNIMECPPDINHWHGASPDSNFSHIGITTNVDAWAPVWWDPVTDKEYLDYHPEI